MEIIPVIDLMQGQVVHAKHGQRQNYQPIQSLLCTGSAPLKVLNALLELYPFTTVYMADIDAIQDKGNHWALINTLALTFPHINFWVDNGIRSITQTATIYQKNILPVIGTENIENTLTYNAISSAWANHHVLSLDFQKNLPLGDPILHRDAEYWPDDVICMNLNQVGSRLGVDTEKLTRLARLNSQREKPCRIYAAGGVRDIDDCIQLKEKGIAGVLIATALHNKTILASDIVLMQHDSD